MIPAAPGPTPVVFTEGPADQPRVGRTLRALKIQGFEALDASEISPALLAAQLAPGRALWLLHAGAFPASFAPMRLPPESATGRPLCAFGAVLTPTGEPPGARALAWSALLARTGGDLSRASSDAPPPLSSVYLDGGASVELAQRLAGGAPLAAALAAVAALPTLRHVRFPPLDVHDDEALRVALAVTSLQQGGAERVVLDLHQAKRLYGLVEE